MPRTGIQLDVATMTGLLAAAFVAMMLARRFRLPYTIALIILGLIISASHVLHPVPLSRELVFTVLLPPLLFDAAINIPVDLLKRNWQPVAALALPGVAATTVLVGYAIHYWVGIPLQLALVFGALISATDPVSVLARFRTSRVDRRLSMLLEGESLFNDGTAAVLYAALFAAAITGAPIDPGLATGSVFKAITGGVLIGGSIGWGISLAMAHIDDRLVEVTLTTIAAYGSAVLSEQLGVSGVIAVISAGIILGYYRSEAVMSAMTRSAVYSFWEYLAFVVTSLFFLLIGIDVALPEIGRYLPAIGIAIGVVIAARIIVVYSIGAMLSQTPSRIPLTWQHMLNLAALRGALAIALALGIPNGLPGADIVLAMTYGVVLWTLLPQGLSIGWFLNIFGLVGVEEAREEYERITVRRLAKRVALAEMEVLRAQGLITPRVYTELTERTKQELAGIDRELEIFQDEHGEMIEEQKREVESRILAAQRGALRRAVEEGVTSDDIARQLVADLFEECDRRTEE